MAPVTDRPDAAPPPAEWVRFSDRPIASPPFNGLTPRQYEAQKAAGRPPESTDRPGCHPQEDA
jgi:hypothetical protein